MASETAAPNAATGARPLALLLGPPDAGKSSLFRELYPLLAGRVELADSESRDSVALFTHPRLLKDAPGGFARRVRSADAVVVLLDAAAPAEEWADTFAGLKACLDQFTEGRTESRAVGGLPVILTLTKCDALARDGDAATDWLHRVEFRKAEVEAAFTNYFYPEVTTPHDVESVMVDGDVPTVTPEPPEPGAGFGSLYVELAAVSLRVPAGRGFAAYSDATGGFGVADFATLVAEAAGWHFAQARHSRRQLRRTVLGTLGLFALMALGAAWLAVSGTGSASILESRVRAYRAAEPPVALRLGEGRLAKTQRQLQAFADDPGFDALEPDLRQFVRKRLGEARDYRAWRAKFAPPKLGPAEVRSRSEAQELEHDLTTSLAPPAEYAGQWADTPAGKLRAKWRADVPLLLAAESRWHDSARDALRRVNALLFTDSAPDPTWRRSAMAALDAKEPEPRSQAIPGSPVVPGPRGRALTYESIAHVTRVDAALRDLAEAQNRLKGLLDLTDAVGLTAPPQSGLAVLDLPDPSGSAADSFPLAGRRLAELQAHYPAAGGDAGTARGHFPAWFQRPYPDAARKAIESRLRAARDMAERHLKLVLRDRLGPGATTPANWRALRAPLALAQEFRDWDRLTAITDDLLDPAPPDSPGAVSELAAFLARDSFPVELPEFELTLPDDLFDRRPTPAGAFVLTVTPAGGVAQNYSLEAAPDPRRGRGQAVFVFRPAGHAGKLVLRPGDAVAAVLPIRAGVQTYKLVWGGGRDATYQFDALTDPPRVETAGGKLVTPRATGVRVAVPPPGHWPTLPRLVPDSRSP